MDGRLGTYIAAQGGAIRSPLPSRPAELPSSRFELQLQILVGGPPPRLVGVSQVANYFDTPAVIRLLQTGMAANFATLLDLNMSVRHPFARSVVHRSGQASRKPAKRVVLSRTSPTVGFLKFKRLQNF